MFQGDALSLSWGSSGGGGGDLKGVVVVALWGVHGVAAVRWSCGSVRCPLGSWQRWELPFGGDGHGRKGC